MAVNCELLTCKLNHNYDYHLPFLNKYHFFIYDRGRFSNLTKLNTTL